MTKIDIAGQVFGRLTAIKPIMSDSFGNTKWLCQCSCGKEKMISLRNLRSRGTRSCGCIREEMRKK
jgi:hypothetical protein